MRFSSVKALAAAAFVMASAPALSADYTLSINTALTTTDPLYKGLESFRDAVAARSNGAIEVKLFPNSQLGPDEDVLEQARAGAPVNAGTKMHRRAGAKMHQAEPSEGRAGEVAAFGDQTWGVSPGCVSSRMLRDRRLLCLSR